MEQTHVLKATESWVQRTKVVWLNASIVVGVLIGIWVSTPISAEWTARIAVFSVAFFNLMFFGVSPRLTPASAKGDVPRTPYLDLWRVIAERPVVTFLFCIQLWGVAQSLGTALSMSRATSSDYVKALPNSGNIKARLIGGCVLMFCVGMVWLLGAVGVWRIRKWAWWLVLCLNGLASGVAIILQMFTPHQFLVDIASTSAVVVLLLPSTRELFRVGSERREL